MRLFTQMTPRVVFIMGGPGSGKSMQAKLMGPAFLHVSTGSILRRLTEQRHDSVNDARAASIAHGDLLPDRDVATLVAQHEALRQQEKVVLLDGFPRTFSQWELYKQKFGRPLKVIDFILPRQEMFKRLCLRQRGPDDHPDAAQHRLDAYFNEIVPVAERIKFECAPHAVTIDASGEPQQIHERLLKALADLDNGNQHEVDEAYQPGSKFA